MLKNSVRLLVITGIFIFSHTVFAQVWLADRDNKQGPGFKLGDSLVLHVGLGLEGGFDSNAMYSSDEVKAGRLRITPYIDLATRSKQRMEAKDGAVKLTPPKGTFSLGVATYYDRYFTKDKDKVDNLNSKFNPFGIDTHLNFTILPQRKFTIIGGVTYVKTLEPYESSADSQNRHELSPALGFIVSPGGGNLQIESKYRYHLLYFSDEKVGDNSNRMDHDISVNTSWKFLPKTALISNVLFSPHLYYGSNSTNVDSLPLKSYLGIQTLILNKFGIKFLAGYGASFYKAGPNFDSFIGDLALMFYMTPFSKISLGVKRDFVDSFYGNYYERDGGYLSYDQLFAGRLLLTLKSEVYARIYSEYHGEGLGDTDTTVTINKNNRKDVWITGSLLLEYRASDWLSFHMSGRLWADVTDFSTTYSWNDALGIAQTNVYDTQFVKFEALAGVRFHY
ncbi:MAG: hypothetical protein JXR91_08670 [Deltaproteobacteria bacterium]|nr:hypothetical protein [Deltaproteobacteria bacterium]